MKYSKVDATNLVVVSIFPYYQIKDEIQSALFRVTIIFILASILLLTIIYFIMKLVFLRYRKLMSAMGKIAEGDLGIVINENRSDEIGNVIHSFNAMSQRLENMTNMLIEKENAKKTAELNALQSQINPHFLFNTLECLKAICNLKKQYEIANTLSSLGKMFRYNINWDNIFTQFSVELSYVKDYLTIMNLRFYEKTIVTYDFAQELSGYRIVKMILQPIVENVFLHGFKDDGAIIHMKIGAYLNEGCLIIYISDDGKGIGEEPLKRLNESLHNNRGIETIRLKEKSVGLINVDSRIKISCGHQYGVSVISELNQGTRVDVKLPLYYYN